MGCSISHSPPPPRNPLEMQQYLEVIREQRERKLKKEQKRIAKLQKKYHKKNRKNKNKSNKSKSNKNREVPEDVVSNTPRISNFNYQTMRYEIKKDEYIRNLENKMQNQLDNDLCLFVMNQISLTLQFFAHSESELNDVDAQLLAKENEINQHLEEHSVLMGNPLDVAINKWVQFQPTHGPDKDNLKPLQKQVMYVVFENIDIARPNDANYDSISPICKVDMETDFYKTTPTKEDLVEMLRENKWKGYVRLKLRENAKTASTISPNTGHTEEETYTDGSSGYSTASHGAKMITSQASSIEKENDYAYVTSLNNHRPLSMLRMSNSHKSLQLNNNVLPDSCVSNLTQFLEPWNEVDSDEEKDSDDDQTNSEDEGSDSDGHGRILHPDYHAIRAIRQYKLEQNRRAQLLQQRYLNSNEFMHYFGELMSQKLAKQLQLLPEELQNGTYVGAWIHTKHYHIVPAIHVAQNWPDCAFQFKRRERPISTNPHTGEQSQWPTRAMIQRIESFGFHVIPIGFAPKRHRNPFRQLEWRIVFPKAQRFLERSLSNAQIKVFMMCKVLVKSFVEPQEKENNTLMFTIDYLRTHLFWECERNYTTWPEEFLGEVLLRFLKNFVIHVRAKTLRDYFIEERNLFESIPDFALQRLNQIISDIIDNPLMHMLVACRNLNYTKDFFPKLNFRKLYDNLINNDLMKLRPLSKSSRKGWVDFTLSDEGSSAALFMSDEGTRGLVVGSKEHREKTKGKLRRRTQVMRHKINEMKQLDRERTRGSVESIDVEYFFSQNFGTETLNQGVENLRRTNVLEIILDHLLATAERATHFSSVQIAEVQLEQARRLCKFYQNYGCDMGAQEYQKSIRSTEEEIILMRRMDSKIPPPALPVRTSVEPLKSTTNKIMDIQEALSPNENPCETTDTAQKNSMTPEQERCESSGDECESSTEQRSLRNISQIVVDVHASASDFRPNQKREGYSPVSLEPGIGTLKDTKRRVKLYEQDVKSSFEDEEVFKEKIFTVQREEGISELKEFNENIEMENLSSQKGNAKVSIDIGSSLPKIPPPLMNKFGSVAGILKHSSIAKSKAITKLTASAEKLLTSKKLESTRMQVEGFVKKKTIEFKGIFN